MNQTRIQITPRLLAIVVLTVATAIIHIALAFVALGAGDTTTFIMFMLNGLAYLILLAAYYLDLPLARDYPRLVRWAFIALTAVTILAWAPRVPFETWVLPRSGRASFGDDDPAPSALHGHEGFRAMQCYECAQAGRREEAIALCRFCMVGLCLEHWHVARLGYGVTPQYTCVHLHPGARRGERGLGSRGPWERSMAGGEPASGGRSPGGSDA